MIWLSVFGLDMHDDLLGLQVVQCCKRSILTGCIYSLVMGCLCPLIFHYWCIFRLVAWIWVVYALSHMIYYFLHVEGMRCCYQVQSWWRIVVDYADRLDILRARCSVHGCDHGVIDFGMTWLVIQVHPWCSLAWIFWFGYGGISSWLRIMVIWFLLRSSWCALWVLWWFDALVDSHG